MVFFHGSRSVLIKLLSSISVHIPMGKPVILPLVVVPTSRVVIHEPVIAVVIPASRVVIHESVNAVVIPTTRVVIYEPVIAVIIPMSRMVIHEPLIAKVVAHEPVIAVIIPASRVVIHEPFIVIPLILMCMTSFLHEGNLSFVERLNGSEVVADIFPLFILDASQSFQR